MNIEDFKTKLGAGGARPNQFRVDLNVPTGLPGGVVGDYSLLVTAAAIPASTVNPTVVQYRGREVKLAGERIFDPWTITVVNDTDQTIRTIIENWMASMNDNAANTGNLNPAAYQTNLKVYHLDRNDNVITNGTYTLVGAFPIQMSEIALAYAQNDVLEEYTVTFQYQYYLNADV